MQTKLYELRKNKKVSQKDIAQVINVHRITYGDKESGRSEFTQDEMFELSKYFGLPIDQIFLPRGHQNGD